MPRGVSTCKILTFQDQLFLKYKAQKIVKFSFAAILTDFIFCPQNLWHFEDVPIKCPKQFLYYIEFICRRTCEKKASLNFMSSACKPTKSGCFFGKFTVQQVLKSFSGRNNSLEPSIFGCSDSLPYGLEESKELRAFISWVLG